MKKYFKTLESDYENACNNYLKQLLIDWGYSLEIFSNVIPGWWVADEVGGMFCLEDGTFISMNEIIYCVKNNITFSQYNEYVDYNLKCDEYGFNQLNINSFFNGAPRVNEETFEKLNSLKQQISETIEEAKDRFKGKEKEDR
jgi:hypothetical protein